jgi:hypothetical protein
MFSMFNGGYSQVTILFHEDEDSLKYLLKLIVIKDIPFKEQ